VSARALRPLQAPDALRLSLFLVHAAIVGYVASGWTAGTRPALLAYLLLLPLIVLQWLVNRGASLVSNLESLARSHRWRDPQSGREGELFRGVLASAGIRATQAQITTVLVATMLLFWLTAFFRMILITG
jgi:hypothetical protein